MIAASVLKHSLPAFVLMLVVEGAWFLHSWGSTEPQPASTRPARARLPAASSALASEPTSPFESSAKPANAGTDDPLSWPACDGVQVVIVTESSDPWWSMTTLREAGQSQARLRRVGDAVGGKQVAFIGYNDRRLAPTVWLEGAGAFCQSTLLRGQAGSLLATLGLQSGDRLESINGFNVASPAKALEAYARLRTAERLDVRLSRRGRPVELTLNIN